ncbi:hypothetical protein FA15DRAFT_595356 [Coprinopsis marcescibilis]|uniref:Transmembrane protein n=1 Tax=Coprinopsis marcescibilis TaxID=230819 RepID=A0A5C3KRM3_COPMA|nr:hypothetical protein FA15DRAFT_595356 [Coprinopsis marcescibilis]
MPSSTTRTASAAEQQTQQTRVYDPIDEFFGYRFASSATQESRHDRTQSVLHYEAHPSAAHGEALPAYAEEDDSLPKYTPHAEPTTLAMYLFKFGFLFPIFWILGALILVSPLREPPAGEASPVWMPEKTEAERQAFIAHMREAEVRWAKRCLWALVILTVLALVGGLAVWTLTRN